MGEEGDDDKKKKNVMDGEEYKERGGGGRERDEKQEEEREKTATNTSDKGSEITAMQPAKDDEGHEDKRHKNVAQRVAATMRGGRAAHSVRTRNVDGNRRKMPQTGRAVSQRLRERTPALPNRKSDCAGRPVSSEYLDKSWLAPDAARFVGVRSAMSHHVG